MDYKELSKISETNNFWLEAKLGLIDTLLHKIDKRNIKILNIGTGTGEEIKVLKKYGKVYAIDINSDAIKMIPKGLCEEKKVCDATDITYPDEFFDLVTSFDVFEHIKNDSKSVREVKRILKPSGYLIFTVPAFQFLFSSRDKALEHKRRYNKAELRLLLKKFHVVCMGYWNFFLFIPISIMRLLAARSRPKLDHVELGRNINFVLYNILEIENRLIRNNISLPIGLTIYGICKK